MYTGDDDSIPEAHIREKVTYKVEKFGAIVHMKRSLTTLTMELTTLTRIAIVNDSVFNNREKLIEGVGKGGTAKDMLHKREVNLQVNFIIAEKMNAAKQAVKEGCRTPEGVQRMEIATMPKRNLENAKRNL